MIAGGETLMKQLYESFSTWLIQRQSNPEMLKNLLLHLELTSPKKKPSPYDESGDTGFRSVRDTFEYFCHPDMMKNIRVGQTLLLSHSPREHALINVRNFKASKFWSRDSMHTILAKSETRKIDEKIALGGR